MPYDKGVTSLPPHLSDKTVMARISYNAFCISHFTSAERNQERRAGEQNKGRKGERGRKGASGWEGAREEGWGPEGAGGAAGGASSVAT